jgi:hypothetical protein
VISPQFDGELASELEPSPDQQDQPRDQVGQASDEPSSGRKQSAPRQHQPIGEVGRQASRVTWAMRALAAAVLAGWLSMLMVSAWTTHLQVCNEEVARVGGAALVKSCGSMSITDAPSLALLVIAGILLLPGFSVLEIPGILKIERKLEQQTKRQDEIASMIQRLELSIAQRVEINNYYERNVATALETGELVAQQDEKSKEFNAPPTRSQPALWQ